MYYSNRVKQYIVTYFDLYLFDRHNHNYVPSLRNNVISACFFSKCKENCSYFCNFSPHIRIRNYNYIQFKYKKNRRSSRELSFKFLKNVNIKDKKETSFQRDENQQCISIFIYSWLNMVENIKKLITDTNTLNMTRCKLILSSKSNFWCIDLRTI